MSQKGREAVTFSQEELDRYNRQMMMEGWGEETQAKSKSSTVFIAGAGNDMSFRPFKGFKDPQGPTCGSSEIRTA